METKRKKPSVVKLNADTYQLKWENYNWATIVLVDHGDNKRGNLMIQSDWGDYHAGWGSMGCSLREFLLNMGNDYITKNLGGAPDWVDEKATEKAMIKYFKDKHLPKDTLEYNKLDIDEFFSSLDEHGTRYFWAQFWHSDLAKHFEDGYDVPCVVDYPPQLRRFMEICWPEFINILKGEFDDLFGLV